MEGFEILTGRRLLSLLRRDPLTRFRRAAAVDLKSILFRKTQRSQRVVQERADLDLILERVRLGG